MTGGGEPGSFYDGVEPSLGSRHAVPANGREREVVQLAGATGSVFRPFPWSSDEPGRVPGRCPPGQAQRSRRRLLRLGLEPRRDRAPLPERHEVYGAVWVPLEVCHCSTRPYWHVVVFGPLKLTTPRLRSGASPLLEEEGNAVTLAEVPHLEHPVFSHRARLGAALSADDDPRDSAEVDVAERTEQRFDGEKPDGRRCLLKVTDSHSSGAILYGDATPDVWRCSGWSVAPEYVVTHQRASLREDLVDVPIGRFHRVEDLIEEVRWYFLVEEVAYGVHEDPSRPFPRERLQEPLRAKREIEPVLKRMAGCPSKSLGKAGCVTVVATARDLRTTRYRVPGRVCPFDGRVVTHW